MKNSAIEFLNNTFQEDEFRLAIRAFRENSYIWQALQKIEHLQLIYQKVGSDVSRWTPANIALITTGFSDMLDEIANHTLIQDTEIRYKAAAALETMIAEFQNTKATHNLRFACLAALGIRERWLVLDEAEISFFDSASPQIPIWATIGIILHGMIPNPKQLINFFIQSENPTLNSTAIEAVITQPTTIENQTTMLLSGLQNLSPYHRTSLLVEINQRYPALAQNIASNILDNPAKPKSATLDPYQQILHYVEKTELLKITKQFDRAMPTLEQIWETTTRLQANLAAQLAQAAAKGNDQKTATEAIRKVNKIESFIDNEADSKELKLAQINTGGLPSISPLEPAAKTLQDNAANATILLTKAKHAYQNNQAKTAKKITQQAYQLIFKAISDIQGDPKNILKSYPPDFFETAIELLLFTKLLPEANNLADTAKSLLPNNPAILWLSSKINRLSGNLETALENAYVAAALSPENNEYQRYLVNLLLELEKYQEAVQSATQYIRSLKKPATEDFLLIAQCTYYAGDLKKSEQFCLKGLSYNPKSAELLILLGKVKANSEKPAEAIDLLGQAILLAPTKIEPWLEISSLYIQTGQTEKAVEKLSSAAEINPNNPIIFLEIGKIHLQQNSIDKALEILNQAARFIKLETDINVQKEILRALGRALIYAGYIDDAKILLHNAHTIHSTDEEIAYLYAQTLLSTNELEKAINTLEIPIQAGTTNHEIYLDYASALINLKTRTSKATEYISLVLEKDPKNERAQILQAHAAANSGDHKLAIQLYQNALQTKLGHTPEYFSQLVSGIAQAAYEDNQPEVAITFLKDALQKLPNNLELQKLLCQALTLANLSQDAFCLLLEIYENTNHDLDLMIWISDQAIALRQLDFSEEILNQALQISPNKAEIIVRLGYIQLENGQEENARITFDKLFSAKNADIKDLKMAAHALISLGDLTGSIPYIEKALEISDYQSNDLLDELTNLHLKSGQYNEALNTLQKHLKLEKTNPELWLKQSDIYNKLSQPKAALNAIFEAVKLAPKSAPIHAKAASLMRQNQEFKSSIKHINEALKLDPENNTYKLQAAEIFRACLMMDSAAKIIPPADSSPNNIISMLLLQAEINIEKQTKQNLQFAKMLVEKAEKLASTYPRLLAIQSRVHSHENNKARAKELFDKALVNFNAYNLEELDPLTKSTILVSIGRAALTLKLWDMAIQMGEKAIAATPSEPRPKLFLAEVYTTQAEYKHICQAVKVTSNAPGKQTLNAGTVQEFQKLIKQLKPFSNLSEETERNITRWENRGSWAFNITEPNEQTTLHDHTDLAAYLAASRRAGNQPKLKPEWKNWFAAPEVKFQQSLALTVTDRNKALEISAETISMPSLIPLSLANFAFITARLGEFKEAAEAIAEALTVWPDEPAWHELAAQVQQNLGNTELVITHLEHAAKLAPENAEILFSLAQTYLDNNMPGNAIRLLENSIQINPLETNFWTSLANAQLKTGEYLQARDSIEKAINLAPSNLYALLIAADIAQKQNDTENANTYLDKAVLLQPQTDQEIILLMELLSNQKRTNEALDKLDQLINLSISPIPLLLQKATMIGKVKGIKDKKEFLFNLAQEHSNNPNILAHLTFSLIENGQQSEAIRTGLHTLKLDETELSNSTKSSLHYQLGKLLHNAGQLDQAIHHLTKTIKLTPNCIDAYLQIGETLQLRREYEKSMDYLLKATKINPTDPRSFLAAGLLSKESKDYTQAEIYLRRAAALAPKDINIQRQLAQVIALALIHQPLHEKV